jgi:hypothetical protein
MKEAEIRSVVISGQSPQIKSSCDPISTEKQGMVVCDCHPTTAGSINRRIMV